MDKRGIGYACGAYFFWGIVPIYWKWIKHVPALQLLGHRITWSFLLLILALSASRKWPELRILISDRKALHIFPVAALLVGLNWYIYVWSVNAGFIVEASLGYFINPLLSVLLGVLFLKERLRLFQWISVGLAAAGVAYLTLTYGRLPWIALSLAFTFGLYGLVKKISPFGPLQGLTMETGILFMPALIFLVYQDARGHGAFLHTGAGFDILMAGAGFITTIPLLMFASAAQRIPLTIIGIIHYITPTCQLMIGVLVFGEAFGANRVLGFGIVWMGLILFILESVWFHKTPPTKPVPELGEG